jgi:hypothetical protein
MIRSLLNIFAPKASHKINTDEGLSNQKLLDELVEHFKDQLKSLSVGKRMLYPMSFNVLLHHEDYDTVKQSFPFVLPEVVKEFYEVIRQMKSKYPDYTPAATNWAFQFSSCQLRDVNTADGRTMVVNKGHITTIASLMTVDLRKNNVDVSNNTRISIKLQDSDVMNNVNLNWNAVTNIDIISENYFICKFDMSLNSSKSVVMTHGTSQAASGSALATLSYAKEGKNYTYTMVDPLIEISGPKGQKGVSSIFVLENEGIMAPHVQIRYLADTGKFQIVVFGKTKLNGKELEVSQDGMAKWYALANNSKIFINDEISVKFEVR